MKLLFSRLILSLVVLASLCGSPSSFLGQEKTEETAAISHLLPHRMNPSYKSKNHPQLNEISITPPKPAKGEKDTFHYARCWRKVGDSRFFKIPCTVYFYSGVKPKTGGHFHDHKKGPTPGETMSKYVPFPRAGSSVDYTYPLPKRDPNFRMKGTYTVFHRPRGFAFKVEASVVGQQEDLSACNGFPLDDYSNCAFHTLHVKYHPKLKNFRSTLTKKDGKAKDTMVATGIKTTHPDNHYGNATFNQKLESIASNYYEKFHCYEKAEDGSHLGYQAIGVNDMSLPYGGLFDVDNNWKPPHSSPGHAKGLAADIRVRDPIEFPKTAKNSIIYDEEVIAEFLKICAAHKMNYVRRWPEYIGTEKEHVHVEKR